MAAIRKICTSESWAGYCNNKKCELFNMFQGAVGCEGKLFTCIDCGKLMHTSEATK